MPASTIKPMVNGPHEGQGNAFIILRLVPWPCGPLIISFITAAVYRLVMLNFQDNFIKTSRLLQLKEMN